MSRLIHRTLVVLLVFGAVSSFGGGVLGVFFGGAGVPLGYLEGTPFTTFVVPGLILGVVVGGTQAVAALGLLRRHPWSGLGAAVAGFGMIIWIFVELALIGEFSWLQVVYLALGIAEVSCVLVLRERPSLTRRGGLPER